MASHNSPHCGPHLANERSAMRTLQLVEAFRQRVTSNMKKTLLGGGVAVLMACGVALAGPHDPVKQEPLSPAEAQRRMVAPDGFEVRLFASEPDVVNPVAMTWDERGRLWIVELYEYPKGAKKGARPRDRVKILEDTDADGKADKVTVFADGFDLATAVIVGNGGVYVGAAPHLYFLKDTNGDDIADTREVVLTGFGRQDTHELLNNFAWGPDGWLYMTQGVFTHSLVKDPQKADDPGVKMNAAVGRFHPVTKKFELFADGMSNQWGVDWDRYGNAFCSACVIDHLFHVAPGGYYVRQAGQPGNPYVYDLLKSIVNHRHQAAAYSGICVYQGDQWPEKYKGTLLMGNIHANRLNHDRVEAKGSSFVAHDLGDFLISNDGWFRPVCTRVGPDGAVWVMDWYDSFPCYQTANANPEGLDRGHGRIWRVVWTGKEKGKAVASRPERRMDLSRLTDARLVRLLAHPNVWHRREAQRLLTERKTTAEGALMPLLANGETLEARMAALWTLYSAGRMDARTLDRYAGDKEPAVRAWVARLTGEMGRPDEAAIARLVKLAEDKNPTVRAGVAYGARKLNSVNVSPIVSALLMHKDTDNDPALPQMIWMAAEPRVADDSKMFFDWMADKGAESMPASGQFLRKMMRRIRDGHGAGSEQLSSAIVALDGIAAKSPALAAEGVRGLLESYKKGDAMPKGKAGEVLASLSQHGDGVLAERAQTLAALWGMAGAAENVIKIITDASAPEGQRITAIRTAPTIDRVNARLPLRAVLESDAKEVLKLEAIRALGQIGNDRDAIDIVNAMSKLSAQGKRAAAEVLAQRPAWANALLAAVQEKKIAAGDIHVTAIRTITRHGDEALTKKLTEVVGKFRETGEDKLAAIEAKKRLVLSGPADLEKGKQVYAQTCGVCHAFHGEGANVGPDITGVGRATLDMLLANIIDPSQVIGAGYENTVVETKDGNLFTGRLIEQTGEAVKLLMQGPKEEVIARQDIKKLRTENISVMPEGLLDGLSEQDQRNLVWYVFSPPQDAQEKPVRVEMREKKLVVLARPAGQRKMIELMEYVMDPASRPYLHPVRDPSGSVVLTHDRPEDHPWQHGIYTGLHKVNGIDFWTEKQGKQRFVRLTDVEIGADQVTFKSVTEWVGPDGKVVLDEGQAITVHAMDSADRYRADFVWSLKARDQTVKIGRHDYGGFAVRPRKNEPMWRNSEGKVNKPVGNQAAGWCNVSNKTEIGRVGIAVIDHPRNMAYPSLWRIDDFGFLNPSPSLKGDWVIEQGKQRMFRYRIVVHKGEGDAAVLSSEAQRFGPG